MNSIFDIIDYTLLDKNATDDQLNQFVKRAIDNKVVSICVYPESLKYIYSLKLRYPKFPKICIVINFPSGKGSKLNVFEELTLYDLQYVDEIDVVWNYEAWGACGIGYDPELAIEPIDTVVDWCKNEKIKGHEIIIKVILETGFLCYPDLFGSEYRNLQNAIYMILSKFNDSIHFLKTSTGKSDYGGASIDAVKTMINSIRQFDLEEKIGIKVSGGINTNDDMYDYLYLFEETEWKGKIRFGSSKII